MPEIDLSRDAEKFLLRLPSKHAGQIARKIQQLKENPAPQDAQLLRGYPYMRVDSGEYRIIYRMTPEVVHVVLIGKRNDDKVYRKLKRR